jgi:hypothetical protein
MKTRRDVLKIAALTTLTFIGGPVFASANGTSVKASSNNQEILNKLSRTQRVVRKGSVHFDDTVDAFFPGIRSNILFDKQLSKFALIIINNSKVPVYGYTVCWRALIDKKVTDRYRRRLFKRPTTQLRKRAVTTTAPLLFAGDALLITPLFVMTSRNYVLKMANQEIGTTLLHANRLKNNAKKLPRGAGFIERNAEYATDVVLEAVIFPDEVLGKKRQFTANFVRNRINGEHDEASNLYYSSLNADRSLNMDLLNENIRRSLKIGRESPESSPYIRSRIRFASNARYLLNSGSPAEVANTLVRVASIPKADIR